MNRGTVLSLCDRTGVMVQPWLDDDFDCIIIDIQHPRGRVVEGRLTTVGSDILTWLPPLVEYEIVFAFPPCTHLAVSGARWWKSKGLSALIEGLQLVEACRKIAEWSGAPYMLENPIGALSTNWRKPDHSFDPCDFGGYLSPPSDPYTKRTNLWTGGGFVMPPPRRIDPTDGSKMHRLPPSADRTDLRSVTPRGFAQAVFEANVR